MQSWKRLCRRAISSTLGLVHPFNTSAAMTTSIVHPLRTLRLDKQYYIHNADLHFQVEQTIFRVHGYFFSRESPHFRERMAGPDCGRAHDGCTDNNAIPVKDTSAEDFSHFLWVFYNPTYTYSTSASVWRVILTLSSPSRWDFPKIHALALKHLKEFPLLLVDRIVLYKLCSVQIEHLLPLYTELCLREESLTLQESIKLGWEPSVTISQVRERLLRGEVGGGGIDADLGMEPAILENIPKDQVQELVRSALGATEDLSSVFGLRGPHKCTTLQDVCDQTHSPADSCTQSKSAMKTRTKHTPRFSENLPSESSKTASKSKVPAVDQAQKLIKNTVAQLRVKNSLGARA